MAFARKTLVAVVMYYFCIHLNTVNCQLLPAESTTTTTSSAATASSTTPTNEGDTADVSSHITCDFDLENIQLILPYLPEVCTEIYNNRLVDVDLFQNYLDETENFKKFFGKLHDYELRDVGHDAEGELLPFAAEQRYSIYNSTDFMECVSVPNETINDFLICKSNKYLEMLNLVPSSGK